MNKGLYLSNPPQTFDVFIIHAVRDESLIESIQEEFRSFPRIRVLIAERRRRPGFFLAEKIRELIDTSHLVIVVWTPNLEKSITANQEIGYALALNKPIFPLVFAGMKPGGLLEGTEYIECDPVNARRAIQALIEDIRSLASELGYSI